MTESRLIKSRFVKSNLVRFGLLSCVFWPMGKAQIDLLIDVTGGAIYLLELI